VPQVQYYDMPRKPGDRVESADTLGRKCWAMSYNQDKWNPTDLQSALSLHGLAVPKFIAMVNKAIPLTQDLCQKVICNCFVNASYDPSRSGGCKTDIYKFHYLGFDREGISHESLDYPYHEHCS
jgi:hypothetical protein